MVRAPREPFLGWMGAVTTLAVPIYFDTFPDPFPVGYMDSFPALTQIAQVHGPKRPLTAVTTQTLLQESTFTVGAIFLHPGTDPFAIALCTSLTALLSTLCLGRAIDADTLLNAGSVHLGGVKPVVKPVVFTAGFAVTPSFDLRLG